MFLKRSIFCNFWRTFPVSNYGSTVFFQSAVCSVEWLFGHFSVSEHFRLLLIFFIINDITVNTLLYVSANVHE